MAGGIAAPMPGDAQTGAPPPGTFKATLTVNGQSHEMTLDPRVTLLDLVREHLRLTGPKKGCDHCQRGACTMIVDGRHINSCLTLAVSLDGAKVTRIEGLETGGDLHPMQAASLEHDGFQCGFCTPGPICSAVAMWGEAHVEGLPDLSQDEIRERERQYLPLRRVPEHCRCRACGAAGRG